MGVKVSAPENQTYDGDYQTPEIEVTDSEGNKLAASTDGGVTGDYVVTYDNNVNATSEDSLAAVAVKGINNYSGEVAQTFQIAPAKATILVNDAAKVYGEDDPEGYNGCAVVLTGTNDPLYTNADNQAQDVLGDITIVRAGMGTDENAGVYEDALDATVANANVNYTYTVDLGDFTITPAGGLVANISTAAEDRNKVYDGQPLSIDAAASEEGSTILYSTDGESWTEVKPSITNVGTLTIYVKATNPNYDESAVVSATLQVTPRHAVVRISDQTKVAGANDPQFTSSYGLYSPELGDLADFDGYFLEDPDWNEGGRYTREPGEAAGTYLITNFNRVAIDNPATGFIAANYDVEFIPGTLTITAAPNPNPGGDTPGGGTTDDGGTTPATPTPTPAPTPAGTVATGVATGVIAGALTDDADAETIEDDETPLASGTETIDDDATPLASGKEDRQCWVHWFMFIGMAVSAVYYIGALIHRRSFTSGLKNFEDEILNPNDQNNA